MSRIDRFLESVTGHYSRNYAANINDMAIAMHMGNEPARRDALNRLGEVIKQTMGVAEVLGATQVLRAAAGVKVEEASDPSVNFSAWSCRAQWSTKQWEHLSSFAEDEQTILPGVTFVEAVEDMLERTPLAFRAAADRTAAKISALYSEDHVIAFAKSAEQAVTDKVQSMFAEAIEKGLTETDVARSIVEKVADIGEFTGPWSENYARMAFRTNVNTAVTAGRFRQVQDPDIAEVIPAFQFVAAGPPVSRGGDTRDNHFLADGLIFRVDNRIWNTLAPPLGYQCRCQAILLTVPQLRRMGKLNADGSVAESTVPAGAGPDKGFRHGGRPDLFLQGEL